MTNKLKLDVVCLNEMLYRNTAGEIVSIERKHFTNDAEFSAEIAKAYGLTFVSTTHPLPHLKAEALAQSIRSRLRQQGQRGRGRGRR
jgi:hypothetical protein